MFFRITRVKELVVAHALSDREIFEKVRTVLVDALGVDEDEVTPGTSLIADLGASSIDFLDISFRLERSFEISIDRSNLLPNDFLEAVSGLTSQRDGKGFFTDEGLAKLREMEYPIDLAKLEDDRSFKNFRDLLTVQFLIVMCKRILFGQ